MVMKTKITLALFILFGFVALVFLAAGIVFFYQQGKLWEAGLMCMSVVITVIYWVKTIFKLIELTKE